VESDTVVAAQVLSERTGRLAAQLAGYRGVRILQDNVLWKPPGTKAIGFHQDSSYAGYLVPAEMITCWVSLHETQADAGPLDFARGSHRWPKSPPARSEFHAPDDWLAGPRAAVPDGGELDLVPDDLSLDESFFPVVWDETGYRTPWLSALPDLG
jgi:hypothetical protein